MAEIVMAKYIIMRRLCCGNKRNATDLVEAEVQQFGYSARRLSPTPSRAGCTRPIQMPRRPTAAPRISERGILVITINNV